MTLPDGGLWTLAQIVGFALLVIIIASGLEKYLKILDEVSGNGP